MSGREATGDVVGVEAVSFGFTIVVMRRLFFVLDAG
jgi:hypothetical protein